MLKKIMADKQLFKMILTIAIPIALQNLLASMTQMLDTIMLGELGDLELSASSLANQIFFVFMLFIFGMSGGSAILTAQYWGKKDLGPIKIIMATILRIVTIVGVVLTAIIYILPKPIMMMFTKDQAVIDAGAEYLLIVAPIYLFFGISSTLTSLFRTVEVVKLAVISNATTLIVNGFLNYVLIFGKFGAPALGLKGAAIATLTARFIELIVVLIYVFKVEKKLNFTLKCIFKKNKNLNKDLKKYCTPVVINELIWSLGITMQAALFGHLSTTAVSANTIIGVVQNVATLMIFGVANAAGVIMGKTIGEGRIDLAKQRAKVLEFFAVLLGFVAAGIIILCRDVMVDFYNVEETTKILAKEMLLVTSVIVFFVSTAGISIVGILRGGGDAKYSLAIEVISLWLIAIPLGYLGGLAFNLPIVVVYVLFKSDELVKAILCWTRLAGDKWIRVVTRDDI